MQLHQLSASQNQRKKQRVGRGGKRGTFSGRGVKGQKSRAGRKLRPEWRDALKRIPKKRGYKFKGKQVKPSVLNLADLNIFKEGDVVSPKALVDKGLLSKAEGRLPVVKILGDGELKKKLYFQGVAVSKSAAAKITKAGGNVKTNPKSETLSSKPLGPSRTGLGQIPNPKSKTV